MRVSSVFCHLIEILQQQKSYSWSLHTLTHIHNLPLSFSFLFFSIYPSLLLSFFFMTLPPPSLFLLMSGEEKKNYCRVPRMTFRQKSTVVWWLLSLLCVSNQSIKRDLKPTTIFFTTTTTKKEPILLKKYLFIFVVLFFTFDFWHVFSLVYHSRSFRFVYSNRHWRGKRRISSSAGSFRSSRAGRISRRKAPTRSVSVRLYYSISSSIQSIFSSMIALFYIDFFLFSSSLFFIQLRQLWRPLKVIPPALVSELSLILFIISFD